MLAFVFACEPRRHLTACPAWNAVKFVFIAGIFIYEGLPAPSAYFNSAVASNKPISLFFKNIQIVSFFNNHNKLINPAYKNPAPDYIYRLIAQEAMITKTSRRIK